LKTALLIALHDRFKKYDAWLNRQPLSPHTKRAYRTRLNHFFGYIGSCGQDYGDLLSDQHSRDFAVRDYRTYLKRTAKAKPATVNTTLAAIDHFYIHIGLGAPTIKREDLPQLAPRALSAEEQKKFLREVERCNSAKYQALATVLLNTGIRIGECAALDLDDVLAGARKGNITIRNGKGDKYREVPLNIAGRESIRKWLTERKLRYAKTKDPALFINKFGKRITTAGIDLIIRQLGRKAGLELSAHVLRHTCLTNLVRNGNDLVLVAEIGGHKKLETTRRYTLPSAEDRQKAMEGLVSE